MGTPKCEIAKLEIDLGALTNVDSSRFQEAQLVPSRSSVKLLWYEMLWAY